MAGSRGGKPGQWSARKAQLLALEYRRAGGGYRGGKKKPQRSLDKWTSEEWTTSDGKPAIREGGTTRYLPKKAWRRLTPAQRAATNRKKRRGSQSGSQFVPNTERARNAGRQARGASKSIVIGRAKPRVGDPDVFPNPDAARLRARSLGCIGISRRETPDGEVVWMPCTNMSDYRRRTGVGVQAGRDRDRAERRLIGRLRREMKTSEDCGCSDPDLSGFLLGAFGDDRKALGRAVRKRIGAGRRKPPLRRVAFDAGAEDADGDGLVQEGTIHQRPAKPRGSRKLRSEALVRDFGSGGKKKKKPKAPVLTQQQRDEMMRQALENQVEQVSRVRKLFDDRAKRIADEYGEVLTKDQAVQALGKAFPNAQITLTLESTLTPSERGMVHTFLDMSISHPKTAARLEDISDGSKGGEDQEALKKKNADASHNASILATDQTGKFLITISQGISFLGSVEELAEKRRPDHREQRANRDRITGIGYLLSRESGDLTDEELDEFYGSYLTAHEFGHAWHFASLKNDLDGDDGVKQFAEFWGFTEEKTRARIEKEVEDLRQTRPNEDEQELVNFVLFSLHEALSEKSKNDVGNRNRQAYLKDGLDYAEYIQLMEDAKGISKYAQASPREAIAESFAVQYLLDGYQNVTRSRSDAMNRIFDQMMKNKSDKLDIDISTVKYQMLTRVKPIEFTDSTCPGFHP